MNQLIITIVPCLSTLSLSEAGNQQEEGKVGSRLRPPAQRHLDNLKGAGAGLC